MGNYSDKIVFIVVLAIIIVWMIRRANRWLHTPLRPHFSVPEGEEVQDSDAVRLLEKKGYEVLSSKIRVPISMQVNDKTLRSRYFIDYTAKKGEQLYLVKLANDKQPVDFTGIGVRDRLLPYLLLFPRAAGVLYVDPDHETIRVIRFDPIEV